LFKLLLVFAKIVIITLVFEKNANFFAKNWQKSQKIVIITSTPARTADFELIFKGSDALDRNGAFYAISDNDHPVTKLLQQPFKAQKGTNVLISLNVQQVNIHAQRGSYMYIRERC
jgi:hypothetical protein